MSPPPPATVALSSELAPMEAIALPSARVAADEVRLRRQAFGAVLFAAFCIGFSPIFVRLADVGPASIGFWRMVFAVGPMALWAYAEYRTMNARRGGAAASAGAHVRRRLFTGRQLAFCVLAGFFFAADLVAFHAALAHTSTANSILLGNTAPVFVLLLAWLCLGERPTLGLMVALALAMTGSAVIVLDSVGDTSGINSIFGDLLAAICAACYASYMIVVRVMRRAASGTGQAEPLGGGMVALLSTAAGAVFCLAYALAVGEQVVPATLQGFLAVAGLGLVAHALGQGLATFALGRLSAGTICIVLLLQILVGMSLAAIMFGEIPSLTVLLGGGLIVMGVLAVRPR